MLETITLGRENSAWLMTKLSDKTHENICSIIESLGDIVYSQGANGIPHFLNNACETTLGYTKDELNNDLTWISLIHPDDRKAFKDRLKEKVNTPYLIQYRIKHKNGKWVWLESRIQSTKNVQGKVTGYNGIARDITQEKEQSEQEQQQNKKLSEAYKTAKIAHFEMDLKASDMFISGSFSEMTGLPAGWHPTQKLNELIHPDDLKGSHKLFRKCMKEKKEYDSTYRIKQKGKTEIKYLRSRGHFEYDNEGNPISYIGTKQDITEKVLTDKHLQESRQMLHEMSNTAQIGGWRVDFLTGKTTWTQMLYDILKLPHDKEPPDEKKWSSFFPPGEWQKIENAIKTLRANRKAFDLEVKVLNHHKETFWARIIGEPVVIGENVVSAKGIFQDITKRKETELALIKSEKNYRTLAEASQDYILRLDKKARLIYANESAKQSWGLQEGELLGKDYIEILGDSESSRSFIKTIKNVFKNKKPNQEIIRAPDNKGDLHYLDWRLYPVSGPNQKVETVLSVARDITERITTENILRKTNDQLTNIIKSVPGAVYKVSHQGNGTFEFISNHIRQISGYTPDDFLSEKVKYRDLIIENDRKMVSNILEKAAENQSEFELSYRIRSKNGKEKWVWEKGLYSLYYDQKVYREGFLMDITDRIKQEDRIISATLQAEDAERRRISQKIHDGVQQTLVSSLMKLQSLEEQISNIADVPSIIEKYREAIRMLQIGVAETRGIAHSIMPISIQEFGLVSTIENMVSSLREQSDIDFSFYQNLHDYRLNNKVETSFYRITLEAVNNILKYSKASEASIQLMKYDDIVILTIEDNGVGFDVNEKNLFYTGLGISSMKSRANAVGAGIEITSHPGNGTNILLEIPLKLTK